MSLPSGADACLYFGWRFHGDDGPPPNDPHELGYSRHDVGCPSIDDPDDDWIGQLGARRQGVDTNYSAVAEDVARSYERAGWNVSRWTSPLAGTNAEHRYVNAHNGTDELSLDRRLLSRTS